MSDDLAGTEVEKLLATLTHGDSTIAPNNRSEATMNAIKSHILRHSLGPGDALPTETSLASELGVSRSSVREALRKLEALDIVQVRQGSGTFVGNMSLDPMVRTLVLRGSLSASGNHSFLREVAEARRALDHGVAPQIVMALCERKDQELNSLVREMTAAAAQGRSSMTKDSEFHDALLKYTGNELLRQMYSSFWLVHTSIVPELPESKEAHVRTAKAHADMLSAAEAGDLPAYRAALDDHYAPLFELLAQN